MIDYPFVSILMPIRNEKENIEATLLAVLAQDYPRERMEIIVVDGLSTDNTREIVGKFRDKHGNIRLLDNPGKIVPKGMNIALKKAKGDVIIRVDGHTIITPDYVKLCIETIKRTNADNVGGCMTAKGESPFGDAVAIATSTKFGIGNSKFHYSVIEEEVDTVYMGAWKKEVFQQIGFFDEELIRDQDDEFNYRIKKSGGVIILNPEIKSVYTTRNTPFSLWKQYFQYGFYKVRVLQKHPGQMSIRQFVPPLFVLSLAFSMIFSLITKWGWIVFASIVGLYTIANLCASILAAAGKSWKHLLRLPITYAIIHLSYGSGFLLGLFKFWNRWGDKNGCVPEEINGNQA